ncbi:MAG: stage III sporulation protein AA, partial [Clostridia bacterium]|nr:stage III sporulation protein AA [Clostridia bacterium]
VVDTRGELYGFAEDALVDVLSGYPKAKGTEIAVRTLSPQVLVLDEIGSEEARSLRDIVSLGVRVVATAHAATGEELLSCESLRELFSQGLFSYLWDVVRDTPVFLKEEKI